MFTSLSSLESAIIKILSSQYPLSSKDILEKIDNLQNQNYSRAGLQRALKSLLDKGILHKHSRYYQLSTDKLINEKQRIQSILDRYIEAQSYHIFQKKETKYYFETLSELDYFSNKVIEQWFNFYPEKRYGYWQKQPFPWFAVMHLDEEQRIIADICTRAKDFLTYSSQNVLSEQLQPIYEQHTNSKMFLVNNMTESAHSFGVFHDHVIETHHPPYIEKVLTELASSSGNAILFSSVMALSAKGSYCVSITKNKEKADTYRDYLLKLQY